MGGFSFYVGRLLKRLHPRGRMIQTATLALGFGALILSGGVIMIPGAAFWGLIYALIFWTPKANVVFSEHYLEVVAPARAHRRRRLRAARHRHLPPTSFESLRTGFGSTLNLHVHFHLLALDGLYESHGDQAPLAFVRSPFRLTPQNDY